jgi:hypothetical protein
VIRTEGGDPVRRVHVHVELDVGRSRSNLVDVIRRALDSEPVHVARGIERMSFRPNGRDRQIRRLARAFVRLEGVRGPGDVNDPAVEDREWIAPYTRRGVAGIAYAAGGTPLRDARRLVGSGARIG